MRHYMIPIICCLYTPESSLSGRRVVDRYNRQVIRWCAEIDRQDLSCESRQFDMNAVTIGFTFLDEFY